METKIFRARTTSEALAAVKAALGPHAVVVKASAVPIAGGGRLVEITAARGGGAGGGNVGGGGVPHVRAGTSAEFVPTAWGVPQVATPGAISRPHPAPARVAPRGLPPPHSDALPREKGSAEVLRELAGIKSLLARAVSRNVATIGASEALREAEQDLLRAGCDDEIVVRIIGSVRDELTALELADLPLVRQAVQARVGELIPTSALGASNVIALVGTCGAGKTTSIAKIAARLKYRGGRSVSLISTDSGKIGGFDALRAFADALDCPFRGVRSQDELRDAVTRAAPDETTLIDTPGFVPGVNTGGDALARLLAGIPNAETHLVLGASTCASVIRSTLRVVETLGVRHVLWTKLDEAEELGAILNVHAGTKLRIALVSTGPSVPDDLELASAGRLARRILRQRTDS